MVKKKKRILTINFGGIGDEIIFFPTLKTIKEVYTESEITLVVEPRSKSCKDLTTLIDNVILCDIKGKNSRLEIIKLLFKIWTGKFDMVISSGSSKFVSILLFLTGIKEKYGYKSGLLSEKILTSAIPLKKQQYAADMYNDLASVISNNKKASHPEVFVSEKNIEWAKNTIGNKDQKVILIHPGVSKMSIRKNIIKFWSYNNWVNLILNLLKQDKYRILLAGGPDDEEIFESIRKIIEGKEINKSNLIDLYGKTKNISQLAALIKKSDLLVCVDSAPMHIAVGTQTPLIALFGPTDENKLLPIQDSKFTVIKNTVECRPCLWDKRMISCDNTKCLDIDVETVIEAINSKLN